MTNLSEIAEYCIFAFLTENKRSSSNEPEPQLLLNNCKGASNHQSLAARIIPDKYQRLLIGFFLFGQMHGAKAYNTTERKPRNETPDWAGLKCMHCPNTYSNRNRLGDHQARAHVGKKLQKDACVECPVDGCPIRYASSPSLLFHVRCKHPNYENHQEM